MVRNFEAFVIGGDADNFSVGANLMQLLLSMQEGEWDEVDFAVRAFQRMTASIKFCPRPVVVAPFGFCFGGGAEMVRGEQGKALQGEGKAGGAIGEGAVSVEVATGGEVSLEGGWALPHLAAAAGEAIVGGGELLVADDPEALGQEGQKEKRGKTLRPPDVDARKGHAARTGGSIFTLVCALLWLDAMVRVTLRVYRASGPGAEALPFTGHHSGA